MLQIEFLIVQSLLNTRVPPNRRNVDHAIPELDKRAGLDGDVQIGNVPQDEVDERRVFFLSQPADEGLRREGLPEFESRESVFREAVVEQRGYVDGGGAELLLLF